MCSFLIVSHSAEGFSQAELIISQLIEGALQWATSPLPIAERSGLDNSTNFVPLQRVNFDDPVK